MKLSKTGTKSKSGFTLIELLVVIAIIGILSSVVLASLSGARESAQVTRMASDLQQIETAMTMWMDAERKVQWPPETDYTLDNSDGSLVSTIASESTLSQYINSVPEPSFGTTGYTYDNDKDTFSCPGSEWDGVLIAVRGIHQEIAQQIQQIIESDGDLGCGKVRWSSGGDGTLHYSLSNDGNL